jgi:hypothetical protein
MGDIQAWGGSKKEGSVTLGDPGISWSQDLPGEAQGTLGQLHLPPEETLSLTVRGQGRVPDRKRMSQWCVPC